MNEKIILQIFKEQMLERSLMRKDLKITIDDIYALLNTTSPAQKKLIFKLIESCIEKGYLEPAELSQITFSYDNTYSITVLGLIKMEDDRFM
ncbi:TPA: hypothetical protein KLD45_003312 [Legionella pneumophila]|uniref:Uncharacterized protein n=1 Tax=Legionella drancourtii LLAP12 TaxID=658187 RepID=G9EQG3_9GAMM|nr:hypothetical protein [Legionella drancourtii]HAT7956523.1 hypothetical protein [Legionella pneumophila]EHL30558.1 hypothetical protein LDG_7510 [Legionella drancourtii LLAP12]HAU1349766.1 hypothetical protein [Legionella pneumophila]HBD9297646.1 hypothetical protein [Legionella pneumophila]HBD9298765.1 hypothetical protein [Legionella pneumophila]